MRVEIVSSKRPVDAYQEGKTSLPKHLLRRVSHVA